MQGMIPQALPAMSHSMIPLSSLSRIFPCLFGFFLAFAGCNVADNKSSRSFCRAASCTIRPTALSHSRNRPSQTIKKTPSSRWTSPLRTQGPGPRESYEVIKAGRVAA